MRNTIIMLITAFIFLSFFTIILPVETCVASGNTLHVGSGQPYSNIQDAINAANESDTVYVHSDTYSENIVIDRTLTLTGEGSGITTISGSGDHTVKVTADSVSISGFTIKNTGVSSSFSSVFLSSVTSGTIQNNIIRDGGNGVYLVSSNSNTVKDNTVEYNNIGIYLSNSDSNTIQSNTIQHNNANGVFLTSTSNSNTIYLNHFSGNIVSNARDLGSNTWDDGISQGNYWDDYEEKYPDAGNDGTVWDTPYDILGGGNQDLYPLVSQKPVATIDSATPNPATQGQTVSFSGHGEDSDGYITGYNWRSSRDGQLSTQASFSTSSLSVGTHTIYFKVKDDDNEWSDEVSTNLVINSQNGQDNQKPTAEIVSITPSTTTEGESIYFHGIGQDSDGMVTEHSWSSNIDGFLSSESTFSKSDLSVGLHIIYFKVKDNDGEWSDEDSKSIIVKSGSSPPNEPPVADPGGPYTGYVNMSISFDASDSYDPDEDEIVSYAWDFGDGTNGTGVSIEHTYNSTGNYTVKLTVTDSQGKTATNSTYANVSVQPTDQNGNGGENGGTPGFEIIFVLAAIAFVLLRKKEKRG